MKAYISECGELTVKAETGIENYALDKWFDDWNNKKAVFHVEITKENFTEFKNVKHDSDL